MATGRTSPLLDHREYVRLIGVPFHRAGASNIRTLGTHAGKRHGRGNRTPYIRSFPRGFHLRALLVPTRILQPRRINHAEPVRVCNKLRGHRSPRWRYIQISSLSRRTSGSSSWQAVKEAGFGRPVSPLKLRRASAAASCQASSITLARRPGNSHRVLRSGRAPPPAWGSYHNSIRPLKFTGARKTRMEPNV